MCDREHVGPPCSLEALEEMLMKLTSQESGLEIIRQGLDDHWNTVGIATQCMSENVGHSNNVMLIVPREMEVPATC